MMTNIPNYINTNLEFLSNEKLINILGDVLQEINATISVGAHRSTLYLAVSAIEAIGSELLKLKGSNEAKKLIEIIDSLHKERLLPRFGYDENTEYLDVSPIEVIENELSTLLKIIEELKKKDLKEIIDSLHKDSLLPPFRYNYKNEGKDISKDISKDIYHLVRNYRNYIHLDEKIESYPKQSATYLALACLNALIEHYENKRFVAESTWDLKYGVCRVSNGIIHMPQKIPVSFPNVPILVTEIEAHKGISFGVKLPEDAIFNFVYNFKHLGDFMAFRIDGRKPGYRDNGRLICEKWPNWLCQNRYKKEPEVKASYKVNVNFENQFEVKIDDEKLELNNAEWKFEKNYAIGFMTELGPVSISNIELN